MTVTMYASHTLDAAPAQADIDEPVDNFYRNAAPDHGAAVGTAIVQLVAQRITHRRAPCTRASSADLRDEFADVARQALSEIRLNDE